MQHHLLLILAICLLVLSACGDVNSQNTEPPSEASIAPAEKTTGVETPQAFMDALDAALIREGEVLHSTITASGGAHGQELEPLWSEELWIDAANDASRRLFHRAPGSSAELDDEALLITFDGVTFIDSGGDEIEIRSGSPTEECPLVDTTPMINTVVGLFCTRYAPQENTVNSLEVQVQPDTAFDGVNAIALVYDAQFAPASDAPPNPSNNPSQIISRFYLDSMTKLPLGWTVDVYTDTETIQGTVRADYSNAFISRDTLARDFFSPVTFVEPPPAIRLYWLGGEFSPGDELPAMAPNEITLPQTRDASPTYQAHLTYAIPTGTEPWVNEIDIQQWARDAWEGALESGLLASDLWLYPCVDSEIFDVAGGVATIYQTYEPAPAGPLPGADGACLDSAHDRFIGIVEIGDTILLINGPFGAELHPRSLGENDDPYNSLAGVRAIINGLQPFSEPVPPTFEASTAPSIEEIYAGLATTLQENGRILNTTQQVVGVIGGGAEFEVIFEYWVEAREPVARIAFEGEYRAIEEGESSRGTARILIRNGSEYSVEEGDIGQNDSRAVEAEGCYGQPEPIAVIIGCPGPTESSTTIVAWGEYQGEPALVLTTTGESHGSDETSIFTRRTYLDPLTFLPQYAKQTGTMNDSPETLEMNYEHQFIDRSLLPEDFFELSAIGYTAPDLNTLIDTFFSIPVYWLGERFEPGGEQQSLVLSAVQDDYPTPAITANYDGIISYALADNPNGPPIVVFQVWPTADWYGEAGGWELHEYLATLPCSTQTTPPAPVGATAILYSWLDPELNPTLPTPSEEASCDTPRANRYSAIVEFSETILVIDAPASSSVRDGLQINPYNTAEGLGTIIIGLERR